MKVSQRKLARFMGVSPQMLTALKKRTRRMSAISAIKAEERTGVPKEELIFLDGPELIERLRAEYPEEEAS